MNSWRSAKIILTGAIHGDFIYTFRKKKSMLDLSLSPYGIDKGVTLNQEVKRLLEKYVDESGPASMNELHVCIVSHLIPSILLEAESVDVENERLRIQDMDDLIKRSLVFDESDRKWHKKPAN